MAREICPRCGTFSQIRRLPLRNALSRKDDRTHICETCAQEEALISVCSNGQTDVWPTFPEPIQRESQ